jgi:hypothetical protein
MQGDEMKLAAGLAFLVLFAGCADSGATKEELALARQEARQVGREEARQNAARRIRAAHAHGFLAGMRWENRMSEEVGEEVRAEEEAELEEIDAGYINPYPIKQNGEPSYEFEPDDIERAEEADQSVREYCEGAVSEAQEVGCLSHVEPWEVP